jgi:hypothetical protein
MQLSLDKALGVGWIKYAVFSVLLIVVVAVVYNWDSVRIDDAEKKGFGTAVVKTNEASKQLNKEISEDVEKNTKNTAGLPDTGLNSELFKFSPRYQPAPDRSKTLMSIGHDAPYYPDPGYSDYTKPEQRTQGVDAEYRKNTADLYEIMPEIYITPLEKTDFESPSQMTHGNNPCMDCE